MQIYDDYHGAYSTHTQGQGSGMSAEEKWAPILSDQCGVTRFHDSADPDHNRTYARSHDLLDLKVVPKCKTGNEATQRQAVKAIYEVSVTDTDTSPPEAAVENKPSKPSQAKEGNHVSELPK